MESVQILHASTVRSRIGDFQNNQELSFLIIEFKILNVFDLQDETISPEEIVNVPNKVAGSITFTFVPTDPNEDMEVGSISAEVCVKPGKCCDQILRYIQNMSDL